MLRLAFAGIAAIAALQTLAAAAEPRPNILWLTSEDHSPHMGCYGDKLARTPNVDGLAAKGMIFKHAWSCYPVCAPARSTIISGMYPASTGAEHMRSMVPMPAGTKMYPQFLREAGYYCTNNSKEDYNLAKPGQVWDESSARAHWQNRRAEPAVLRHLQFDQEPREPDSHAAAPANHRSGKGPRAGLSSRHARGAAGLGPVLRQGERGRCGRGRAAEGARRRPAWRKRRSSSITPITAAACRGASAGRAIRACKCRWSSIFPRNGGASRRRNTSRAANRTGWSALSIWRRRVLSLAGIKPPEWMQGHAFAGPHQTEPQPFVLRLSRPDG